MPQYVDALAQAGWSVDVCAPYPFYPAWKIDRTLPPLSAEHDGAVRITRYAPFVPRRPSVVGRAFHEVSIAVQALRLTRQRAGDVDLVIAASPPLLGARSALWVARSHRRPSLILAYDLAADLVSDAFGLAGHVARRVFGAFERHLYSQADAVIALSDDMADRIRSLAGRSAAISVIRIWADDALRELDHHRLAQEWRAREGISEDRRLIGFAGNFGRKQRLPEVIRALAGLPHPFVTVVIGDGPDRELIKQLGREAGGEVRVLGPQPDHELHAFLSACDISIVTAWTRHAGSLFPSKVANILAAGSPILAITERNTELASLLEREDLGLTCSSLDAGAIRDAAHRGAELGREQARRARCRRYAATHLDRTRAMERFLAVVNRLVP